LKGICEEIDPENKGTITLKQFIEFMEKTKQAQEDDNQELKEAFAKFDKNGDGKIDKEEFKVMMKELEPNMEKDEIEKMMATADADGDGFIDYQEFVTVITTPPI
jgi:Ca2+-binding EF-hand superfamily protein